MLLNQRISTNCSEAIQCEIASTKDIVDGGYKGDVLMTAWRGEVSYHIIRSETLAIKKSSSSPLEPSHLLALHQP